MSDNLFAVVFVAIMVNIMLIDAVSSNITMSARKVGGIWFARIGRLQLSFCVCRPR